MKNFLFLLGIALLYSCNSGKKSNNIRENPNLIIIFTDDQGYKDLSCYGSPDIKTPHIDRLARQGIRFTDFYVASSVCSPSRAALLTGRYSLRNGIGDVLIPDERGLSPSEITIAEMLRPAGYQSACYGKWHLGDLPPSLPTNQGFDEYFGIPYSNDMFLGKTHSFSKSVTFTEDYTLDMAKADQIEPRGRKVPLFEGSQVVEYPCEQSTLTQRYFDRAIEFIDKTQGGPFFLYINPAMPHVPLFASEKFVGMSEEGLYGDVIEEIDWNVGRLMKHLQSKGIEERTMVIFASDNGPWLEYEEHSGHSTPLRDGKFSIYEGGVRVPCIMYWKGKWDAGKVSKTPLSTVDLLPTMAHYAGVPLPQVQLDGVNISEHLENTEIPIEKEFILWSGEEGKGICGIRMGDWKYLPFGGQPYDDNEPELFNLKEDLSETKNLIQQYPEIAERLKGRIDQFTVEASREN